MEKCILNPNAKKILRKGGVFVPSPLALDEHLHVLEPWQRLLTLYYIHSGARAVIPAAHTGEFALNDPDIFEHWLIIVKEMTQTYGNDMLLMAAIGGKDVHKQAETAARHEYDIAMVAPTAFMGLDFKGVVSMVNDLASIIPLFGFELQEAIPGNYTFTPILWNELFKIMYGAKGASFNTYHALVMLEAAAKSSRPDEITLLTGNDDRIVTDLLGKFDYEKDGKRRCVQYSGGLLGHYATDTRAAVRWTNSILEKRQKADWSFPLNEMQLAHAVNRCNLVLFDALGNFENSVWGVKYRLTRLGLLPAPYCLHEKGRRGQAFAIDQVYGEYPDLCDDTFLTLHLEQMKKEVGLTN